MQPTPIKPGFKTSEFWLSLFSILVIALATMGYIKTTDINTILNAVGAIYGGAVGILTIFGIVHSYIQSRTTIKTTSELPVQTTP